MKSELLRTIDCLLRDGDDQARGDKREDDLHIKHCKCLGEERDRIAPQSCKLTCRSLGSEEQDVIGDHYDAGRCLEGSAAPNRKTRDDLSPGAVERASGSETCHKLANVVGAGQIPMSQTR